VRGSVSEPKRLFPDPAPDPDPTFQIIPDPDLAPDPFPDPGQNQTFEEQKIFKMLKIILKHYLFECCTVFTNFVQYVLKSLLP